MGWDLYLKVSAQAAPLDCETCPELGTLSVALESPSPFSGCHLLPRCPSLSDTQVAEPLPN